MTAVNATNPRGDYHLMLQDMQGIAQQAGDNKLMLTPEGLLTFDVPQKKQNRLRKITARIARTLRKFFGLSRIDTEREKTLQAFRQKKDEQELAAANFFCRYLKSKFVTSKNLRNLPAAGEHNNVVNPEYQHKIDKFTGNGLNAVIAGAKEKANEIRDANLRYSLDRYAMLDRSGNMIAGSKAEAIFKAMKIELGKLDIDHRKQVVELYNKEIRMMGLEKLCQWSDELDIFSHQDLVPNFDDMRLWLCYAAENGEFCQGIFRWCDQHAGLMASFMDAFSRGDIKSAAKMFVKMSDSSISCYSILKNKEKKIGRIGRESLGSIVATEALQKFAHDQEGQTRLKEFMRMLSTDQGKKMLQELFLSAAALNAGHDELGIFGLPQQQPKIEKNFADLQYRADPPDPEEQKSAVVETGLPYLFDYDEIPGKHDKREIVSVIFLKQCMLAFDAASEPEDMLLYTKLQNISDGVINNEYEPEFYGINLPSANREMRTDIYHAYADEFKNDPITGETATPSRRFLPISQQTLDSDGLD